jgi:hypothetical protein
MPKSSESGHQQTHAPRQNSIFIQSSCRRARLLEKSRLRSFRPDPAAQSGLPEVRIEQNVPAGWARLGAGEIAAGAANETAAVSCGREPMRSLPICPAAATRLRLADRIYQSSSRRVTRDRRHERHMLRRSEEGLPRDNQRENIASYASGFLRVSYIIPHKSGYGLTARVCGSGHFSPVIRRWLGYCAQARTRLSSTHTSRRRARSCSCTPVKHGAKGIVSKRVDAPYRSGPVFGLEQASQPSQHCRAAGAERELVPRLAP